MSRPLSSSYLQLKGSRLKHRVQAAYALMDPCVLCPRRCRVRRLHGELGFCRSGVLPIVASRNKHYGEEPPISGSRGSGTIFFTNCNLRCRFCQNYPISQLGLGREITPMELAGMMLLLQHRGCQNLNLVTPSHWVPQILEALSLAIEQGFCLPLVYNSNGYDSVETLKLLDRVVDIYLPDMKYNSDAVAEDISYASGYCHANQLAVREMVLQVPDYQVDEQGILVRGLIIRHLILPASLAGSEEIFRFIATQISPETHISLMTQYFPAHLALKDKILGKRITRNEYLLVKEACEKVGLHRGWYQSPDFSS